MIRRSNSFTSRTERAVAPALLLACSASFAVAIPWAPKESTGKFREVPPQKRLGLVSESAELAPAPQPKSLPAILETSTSPEGGPLSWTFLGPAPIPNGQTNQRQDPVSGRVTAIAVHPTNADIAYVGTAQGGLYRTLNGGGIWTQLMDNANAPTIGNPLAIGAVAIDPTDSTRVFVGTGEGNLSADSYFGSGFYIITAAESGSPTVNGPFNAASGNDPAGGVSAGADVFTGRSIVAIAVDPTNANNIFVSTSVGLGGIQGTAYPLRPRLGVYRSTNALSASPTWTRLQVGGTSANTISSSLVMEPGTPNNVVVAMYNQAPEDPHGIYRTTNALAATPTFTQTLAPTVPIPNATPDPRFVNIKLAIQKSQTNVVTVYATADQPSAQPTVDDGFGTLYKSTDGGSNWARKTGADGFAGFQGFYDLAVGVDPNNPNNVGVGGQAGNRIWRRSQDGGETFVIDTGVNEVYPTSAGLHADTHAIAYAPSNGSVIYHGNDGGIWRSNDAGTTWISLNNSTFSATQFMALALHPTDPKFSIGGTQDNGTPQLRPDGTWFRVDFGDGGYSVIDQNATDTTNVVQYHTYFNAQAFLTGTGRVLNNPCAVEGQWAFRGVYGNDDNSAPGTPDPTPVCDGSPGEIFNGIGFFDFVNFYAPMTLGPGNPNTWYFGTDRLYRSTNRADTAVAVSAFLGDYVNSIEIAPQDDNYRVVGTNFGLVFATTTGGPLVQIGGQGATNGPQNVPANFPNTGAPVNRIAIDPNNKNIAYVAFGAYGTPAAPTPHIYKISNLDALTSGGSVIFTAMSNGLPDLPVNALAIDPQSGSATRASSDIYAGTDIGVYKSSNGGASWAPYLSGMPRVAVFGLEVQNNSRLIRAATHGRGMYDAPISASPALAPALSTALSRKSHGTAGTFDINMPLVAPSGVEPRRGSAANNTPGTHTIVLRFTNTVASGTATYTPGSGAACNGGVGTCTGTASTISFSGTDMTVVLTNMSDVQTGTLTVSNVTDTNGNSLASASIPLGFNIGDVTGNRTVNSADATMARNNSGQPVNVGTFRSDVTVDGNINSADALIIRNKSGSTIP